MASACRERSRETAPTSAEYRLQARLKPASVRDLRSAESRILRERAALTKPAVLCDAAVRRDLRVAAVVHAKQPRVGGEGGHQLPLQDAAVHWHHPTEGRGEVRVRGQRVDEHAAVGSAGEVDLLAVDGEGVGQRREQRLDEEHVVVAGRPAAARLKVRTLRKRPRGSAFGMAAAAVGARTVQRPSRRQEA